MTFFVGTDSSCEIRATSPANRSLAFDSYIDASLNVWSFNVILDTNLTLGSAVSSGDFNLYSTLDVDMHGEIDTTRASNGTANLRGNLVKVAYGGNASLTIETFATATAARSPNSSAWHVDRVVSA